VSFAEIAKQTTLTEQMVGRIIRHAAATMHVFCEPEPGMVAHTKASRMLAGPEMTDWMRAGTEELGSAAGKVSSLSARPSTSNVALTMTHSDWNMYVCTLL